MDYRVRISGRISKPVEEVFEAVADPSKLSGYFTTGGAKGRLETGAVVTWDFADFPGAFPVRVAEVLPNRRIVLHWGAMGDSALDPSGDTTVTMTFEALEDGRTLVTIVEEGWKQTPEGLKASYSNCEGWSHMLCAMKAFVEYGINLREGFYK